MSRLTEIEERLTHLKERRYSDEQPSLALALDAREEFRALVELVEPLAAAHDIHAWGETIDDPALPEIAAALAALAEALP